jgi:transposase
MHFIGCDVSKLTLDVAGIPLAGRSKSLFLNASNDRSGWMVLTRWLDRHWPGDRSAVCLVMEATGVYHLLAAGYFHQEGFRVTVCNPGRAAQYSRSQNRLNKSDASDALSLQRYGAGLERIHWFEPAPADIAQLNVLLGLMGQLERDIRRWSNRLEKTAFLPAGALSARGIRRQIRNLEREVARTQAEIDALVDASETLARNQQLMCSITGIGAKTSLKLLPLVQRNRFQSARQMAAFMGLTPCHRTSGTSLRSPGRLSGRGDPGLRAALYMPAVCAIHRDPQMKCFYRALIKRGKTPKQAITAIMRKLVHLCYGVVKHQTPYQEDWQGLPA